MIPFSSLSAFGQTMIPLLLFAEAVLELGLFLYQILRSKRPLHSPPCVINFVILLTLLFSVTQGDPDEGKDAFLLGAPWLLFVAVISLPPYTPPDPYLLDATDSCMKICWTENGDYITNCYQGEFADALHTFVVTLAAEVAEQSGSGARG